MRFFGLRGRKKLSFSFVVNPVYYVKYVGLSIILTCINLTQLEIELR